MSPTPIQQCLRRHLLSSYLTLPLHNLNVTCHKISWDNEFIVLTNQYLKKRENQPSTLSGLPSWKDWTRSGSSRRRKGQSWGINKKRDFRIHIIATWMFFWKGCLSWFSESYSYYNTSLQCIQNYHGGFSGGSVARNPPASAGDTGLIPGLKDPTAGRATMCAVEPGSSTAPTSRTSQGGAPTLRNLRRPACSNRDTAQPKIKRVNTVVEERLQSQSNEWDGLVCANMHQFPKHILQDKKQEQNP